MISDRFTHPCVIIDVLADVWVEEVIQIFVAVFVINVWADVVIDMLSGAQQVAVTIDVVSGIRLEVLTEVNANVVVAAAMTAALELPTPAP